MLLVTRMRAPPRPRRAVERPRLVDAIEREIPHHKLILLAAPAGYGKTTLLSQWAHVTSRHTVWLTISAEDDAERVLRYLVAGWKRALPQITESPLAILLGAMSPEIQDVLAAFVNVAHDQPECTVFILDDYDQVTDPSVHEAMTFLLDHLPPTTTFVLSGRGEPKLPLARYRAAGDLLELSPEDLQFQPHESKAFLSQVMGLAPSDAEIGPLHSKLEGWVAGLQLVGLGLRRGTEAGGDIDVSGRQRFIADYLRAEVLGGLPDDVVRFLLETSILDDLCGALCDVVTGSEGGQARLNWLEGASLFLAPLDDRREWYRYHHLFRDFLHEELIARYPDDVRALHHRAAGWYLDHNLPEPAFNHAIAGGAVETIIQIVERYFAPKLFSGEVRVVRAWLEALPAEWYDSHPMLGLAQAIYLVITGSFDASADWLDRIERALRHPDGSAREREFAKIATVRCAIACFENDLERAESYAERALSDLLEEDAAWRADIYQALGETYGRHGRWDEARSCFHQALACGDKVSGTLRQAHVYGALADLELRRGRLREAAKQWEKARFAVEDRENWGRLPLPVIGWVYIRIGELQCERNALDDGWDNITRGLERAELGGDVRALIAGNVIAARIQLSRGDVNVAGDYLDRARLHVQDASFSEWTSRFERLRVEYWLATDQLRAAVSWADRTQADSEFHRRPENEPAVLGIARILIATGDTHSVERALAMLEILIEAAGREGRTTVAIEGHALRAMARWRRGDRPAALASLARALRLAEPEGYLRTLADLGLPMARLLQEVRRRDVMPDYVGQLLAAIGADLEQSSNDARVISEPLTSREAEILRLLAAGLTNREIADELVISPETVKKHAANIYGKLGVRTRTAAAARALELDLLA